MKLPYENELYELRKWIDFTNANLNMQFLHLPPEIQSVRRWINAMAMGIQSDYPFYAAALPRIANILFQTNGMGAAFVNPAAFGELVIIIRHIEAEPVVVRFWSEIHPRIVNVSHDLYVDGHCSTAAEKAVKEVETELGDEGRILVRESGTEPLVRVMVEARSHEICREKVDKVVKVLREKGHVIK